MVDYGKVVLSKVHSDRDFVGYWAWPWTEGISVQGIVTSPMEDVRFRTRPPLRVEIRECGALKFQMQNCSDRFCNSMRRSFSDMNSFK